MTTRVYDYATYIFDPLHRFWESRTTHKTVTGALVVVFILSIIGIELNRQGLLPPMLAGHTPTNHLYAINLAFNLVLILEVISLIFTLPCSVSKSLGKQFEILALILIRSSFKQLVYLSEPVEVTGHLDVIFHIVSDGIGALAIFAALGLYYRLQKKHKAIKNSEYRYRFVAAKKIVALVILIIFLAMGGYNGWLFFHQEEMFNFYSAFYTLLIFSDILIVLISQQYLPAFHALFRNSGYALSTLLIRLALIAPPYYNVLLGLTAALFAVGLTLTYNYFYISLPVEE